MDACDQLSKGRILVDAEPQRADLSGAFGLFEQRAEAGVVTNELGECAHDRMTDHGRDASIEALDRRPNRVAGALFDLLVPGNGDNPRDEAALEGCVLDQRRERTEPAVAVGVEELALPLQASHARGAGG